MADKSIEEAKQALESLEKEVEKKIGTKDEGEVHALILWQIEKIEAARKEAEIKFKEEEEDEEEDEVNINDAENEGKFDDAEEDE